MDLAHIWLLQSIISSYIVIKTGQIRMQRERMREADK
jgi:hypothetical protein